MSAERHSDDHSAGTNPVAVAVLAPAPGRALPLPCPRCDYDLAGLQHTRTNQLPAAPSPDAPTTARPERDHGTCSECGLRFEWADLLDPSQRRLAGFFEHASGPVRVIIAAWRTLAWSLWPPMFWNRVRLEHRIVATRWPAWPLMLLVPTGLGLCGAAALMMLQWNLNHPATGAELLAPLRDYGEVSTALFIETLSLGTVRWSVFWLPLGPGPALAPLATVAFTSLCVGLVPAVARQTLGRERVGLRAVFRATIYSLGPTLAIALFWMLAGAMRGLQNMGPTNLAPPPATRRWLTSMWEPGGIFSERAEPVLSTAMVIAAAVHLALWWCQALRTGWRIESQPTRRRVLTAQLVVGGLSLACGMLVFHRGFLVSWALLLG